MATSLGAMALIATLGIGPFGHGSAGCPTCPSGGYYSAVPSAGYAFPRSPAVGYGYMAPAIPPGGSVMAGMPSVVGTYGSGSSFDQLNPYDSPSPWMHGYFQHMPAYGGFRSFRPYNYKHVLSQSTTAGQWGMSPVMPYSQQFWHRYQDKASLTAPGSPNAQATFAAEYARELARLKAWRDFQASQAAAQAVQRTGVASGPAGPMPAPANYGVAPGAYGTPAGPTASSPPAAWAAPGPAASSSPAPASVPSGVGAAMLPPPPSRLNPAGVSAAMQMEQLRRQVQEQAQQIQVLQNALNSASPSTQPWAGAATWNGPSRWNPPPRGY